VRHPDFGLADIDAELEKLAVNARRAPKRICDAHLAHQPAYRLRYNWSPSRCLDFQRQYALKPARCQPMIVSGLTIASTSHALREDERALWCNEHTFAPLPRLQRPIGSQKFKSFFNWKGLGAPYSRSRKIATGLHPKPTSVISNGSSRSIRSL
jgi:hypothetical protein